MTLANLHNSVIQVPVLILSFGGFILTSSPPVHAELPVLNASGPGNVELQDQVSRVSACCGAPAAFIDSRFSVGQVFTVGLRGRLSRVELDVFRATGTVDPLIVDIVPTLDGVPIFDEGVWLARRILDGSLGSGGVLVDVASDGVSVEPGQQLSVVLRSAASRGSNALSSPGYRWRVDGARTNSYRDGTLYTFDEGAGTLTTQTKDAGFRTFVIVPEPSPLVLAVACLAAFAATQRFSDAVYDGAAGTSSH